MQDLWQNGTHSEGLHGRCVRSLRIARVLFVGSSASFSFSAAAIARARSSSSADEVDTIYITGTSSFLLLWCAVSVLSATAALLAGLQPSITDDELIKHFGSIGVIKVATLACRVQCLCSRFGRLQMKKFPKEREKRPQIWIYKDKGTGLPKGDATVTYDDAHTAPAAVEWFNGKEFQGKVISVSLAQKEEKKDEPPAWGGGGGGYGGGGGRGEAESLAVSVVHHRCSVMCHRRLARPRRRWRLRWRCVHLARDA